MNLVYFGTGAFGLPSLEALKTSRHRILAVVTAADKPKGRHLRSAPSPIKTWALQHTIRVFEFSKDTAHLIESLKKLSADLFVVISFGSLLKEDLLDLPKLGAFNVHASLLPWHRGASPIRSAILSGDPKTGVTIMRMTLKLDAGDVLLRKETAIDPRESGPQLEARLAILGGEALLQTLDSLEKKTARFIPQDESKATYAGKISKEDGHIDWSEPSKRVLDRIRAMAGWPGAFSFHRGKRVKVLEAAPADASTLPQKEGKPGTVQVLQGKDVIYVRTGDGWIRLLRLQLESKRPLSVADFLKGAPLESGECLE